MIVTILWVVVFVVVGFVFAWSLGSALYIEYKALKEANESIAESEKYLAEHQKEDSDES